VPHHSRHSVSTGKGDFDPRKFLATVGEAKQVLSLSHPQTVFTQGDLADAVFYILEGKVRLTVVSKTARKQPLAYWMSETSSEKVALRDRLSACAPRPS
jgi:CRP-like cAMP-binding protein